MSQKKHTKNKNVITIRKDKEHIAKTLHFKKRNEAMLIVNGPEFCIVLQQYVIYFTNVLQYSKAHAPNPDPVVTASLQCFYGFPLQCRRSF